MFMREGRLVIVLTCDGDHGLLPQPQFEVLDDYPTARAAATAAGWRETAGPRQIFCPEC
jgi:hypothetical protein